MKMSVEHWWNDLEGGEANCPERNLSQCNSVRYKYDWTDMALNPGLRGKKPANNRLIKF
jgi:hypothetical protein